MGADERRDWLSAGRIGRPHGLDGSFHVNDANALLLDAGAVVTIAGGARRIDRRAGHDRGVILRLDGCRDRADAEALRGSEILVDRGRAPALGPDEWWPEELEGCAVHDGGSPVGRVSRLLGLPSCEVLEVERVDGRAALLVPLVGDAVRSVDTERHEIDVDLEFLGERLDVTEGS